MEFKESAKYHLGNYENKQEELNEGIRFFKRSEAVENSIKELRVKG